MRAALLRSNCRRLCFLGSLPMFHRQHRWEVTAVPRLPPLLLLCLKQGRFKFSSLSTPKSPPKRNGFVSWYLGMIEARPVLTKSVTSGVIFTAADVSSQMITLKPSSPYDPLRTLRMAGYGMLFIGPTLHMWFNTVSKFLPKRDVVSTAKKMLLGQTIYGPVMNVIFFSLNAGLQGETGTEIVGRLKRDLIPTFKSGLAYWPLCDFITFRYVPVHLQPLISNSFSYVWTIYITYKANLKKVDIIEMSAA